MDLLFLQLALICMAVMETIQHHFFTSIFAKIESLEWYAFWMSDWRNKYDFKNNQWVKKTGWAYIKSLIDGYHVSKWLMITFFTMAGYFTQLKTAVTLQEQVVYYMLDIYLTHRFFYGYILLAKEHRKSPLTQ